MKTAMQQLKERIKRNVVQMPNANPYTLGYKEALLFIGDCIDSMLEKEKEQIIEAYNNGNREEFYDATEIELSNNYYKQTYNNEIF